MAIQQMLDTAAQKQREEMEALLGKGKKPEAVEPVPPPEDKEIRKES